MYFLSLFTILIQSKLTKNPIILTPSLYCTNLYINYSKGTDVPKTYLDFTQDGYSSLD